MMQKRKKPTEEKFLVRNNCDSYFVCGIKSSYLHNSLNDTFGEVDLIGEKLSTMKESCN